MAPGGRCGALLLASLGCAGSQGAPPESATVSGEAAPSVYVAAFRLEDGGDDERGTPRTRLTFVMHSATETSVLEALGTESGGCVDDPVPAGEQVPLHRDDDLAAGDSDPDEAAMTARCAGLDEAEHRLASIRASPARGQHLCASVLLRVSCWWGPEESQWIAVRVLEGVILLRSATPRVPLPALDDPAAWSRRVALALPPGARVTRLRD